MSGSSFPGHLQQLPVRKSVVKDLTESWETLGSLPSLGARPLVVLKLELGIINAQQACGWRMGEERKEAVFFCF